jgi:DNA-binding IclR family transcriptional regulator
MWEEAPTVIRNNQVAPVTVLDRLSTILDVFERHGPLTLSQVTYRTGMPRSSVHRMLEQLTGKRWLNKIGHEYELGIRLFELGSTVVQQNRLYTGALPLLNELHRISGMVVHLGVLDHADVIYLGKIGGPNASAIPTRVGGRHPAHQTALGRALLAFAEPTFSDAHWPLPLRASIRKIRESGISHESGSLVTGLNCIAAPIGPPHRAIAALSICGPTNRLKLNHHNAVPLLIAAAAIWETVGRGSNQSNELFRAIRILRSMPTAQSRWLTAHQTDIVQK